MGWQRSPPGPIAGSQPAPLGGLGEASTSSANNAGNLRDATEPQYQAERWHCHINFTKSGHSEAIAAAMQRPKPLPTCQRNQREAA
jgi:hypothetical protein